MTPLRSTIAGLCASAMFVPPPVWVMPFASSTLSVCRMLARSYATLFATPTTFTFQAVSAFTPSGPGCRQPRLSGMSISGPCGLTSIPSRLAYTRSACFSVSPMCVNAVVGSARSWMSMSPMISIETALSPYEPAHFHAASAAASAAAQQMDASAIRKVCFFMRATRLSSIDRTIIAALL